MRARISLPSSRFKPLTKLALLAGALGITMMATMRSISFQSHRPVQDGKHRTVTCVFVNPGYSGSCAETTQASSSQSASEACQPILTCLNNPECVQTYCGATQVRSGWILESATDTQSVRASVLK